jgi:hypothetical protein
LFVSHIARGTVAAISMERLGRVDSYTSKRTIIGDSDSPRTSSKTTYFLVPYDETFHHAD